MCGMNKEVQARLLEAIVYYGFNHVFNTLTPGDDEKLNELTNAYRKAYRELAIYVGYPDDLGLLERETIM